MIKNLDGGKIALHTRDKSYTYKELFAEIDKFSQLFKDKANKHIAIYSENRAEWIFAFYAAWKNNCIVVPIDYMSSPGDVSYILNDCKPDVVFTSKNKLGDLNKASFTTSYTFTTFNFDELELDASSEDNFDLTPTNQEETAVIIYTSGTTGSPKGVMLSFKNILSNLNEVCNGVDIYSSDRQVLLILPLHHIFPLIGTMMAPLHVGASIAMSPSIQSSDLLSTLKNNQVRIMIGVPRFYDLIYKSLKEKIDASTAGKIFFKILSTFPNRKLAKIIFKKVHEGFGGNLEIMVSGGAALSPETGKFFKTLGYIILEGYGMTEASPMITFNRPHNFRIKTPGQPLKSVEVKIKDGEIIARGPNIMQGYYNRPEETAEVIKDGWLYTGDLGYLDKNNFLYITGRKKEIIVLPSGKNINPVELEQKLEEHSPFIQEVAVLFRNQKLFALIVPNRNELEKAGVNDLTSYFKKEILSGFNKFQSSYKRILNFGLFDGELPRTRLSKLQRYKLDDLLK